MSRLLELPTEIVIAIVNLCAPADVKRVCESCRSLRDICTPELYRNIQLSSHNANITCEPRGAIGQDRVPPDFLWRQYTRLDYDVAEKQKKLMRTLDNMPGLGKHVRELHWTSLDLSNLGEEDWEDEQLAREMEKQKQKCVCEYEDSNDGPVHVYCCASCSDSCPDSYSDSCRASYCELEASNLASDSMWRAFQSFVNVSIVDICWLRWSQDVILPEPLFPSATSVRLAGCMTRGLVECMLKLSAPRLEQLQINNLLQWSEVEPPLPDIKNARDFDTYWREHKSEHEAVPETRIMAGALDSLIGRCTSLTSLSITTVGRGETWGRNDPWDAQRYSSWARFIDSVRTQLCYFSFKQGICRNLYEGQRMFCRYRPTFYDHRIMDGLFREEILPILLDAPWPHIRRMEIKGVGRTTKTWERLPTEAELAEPGFEYAVEDPLTLPSPAPPYEVTITRTAFHAPAQEALRGLLPHSAELIVEEEPERDYEAIRDPGDHGITDSLCSCWKL